MIQVCSRCGTRWNVRDRQRAWCPRCQGPLLAPSAQPTAPAPPWAPPTATPPPAGAKNPPGANPPGPRAFRWIAVRPGVGPVQRRHRRILSPTPHYQSNPGWGLYDYRSPVPIVEQKVDTGPSPALVGAALRVTAVVLAVAAGVHALRYILLLINRSHLLHPVIAGAGLWLGVLASLAALGAVIWCAVILTRWLIARRAAVYAHLRREDPRPRAALWAGCLVPLVNLVWAPVFVVETATVEGLYSRLRKPITIWWLVWVASTVLAIWAMATSLTTDAQGIADNTVTSTLAYLVALAAVLALTRVYEGFVRKPVDRPVHRWVMVDAHPAPAAEPAAPEPAPPDSANVVEQRDREPAA